MQDVKDTLRQVTQAQLRTQQQIEANQQQIELTQRQVDANTVAIADLKILMERQASETVQWFADVVNRAEEDRAFIRGLQTENRRILDRLERHASDGHGG